MATNKNITMRQYNGVDYDTLYPKTIAAQIDDVYSKSETSNLFLPKAGGSMGGILDMNGNRITNLPTPTSNSEPATKEYVDGIENSGWVKIGSFNGAIGKDGQGQVTFNNIKNIKQIKIVGTINKLVTGQYKSGFITIEGLQIAGCGRDKEYNKTANINTIANVVNFPYCSESNKVTFAHAIDFITYSSASYTHVFTNALEIRSNMQASVNLNIDIYFKYYD